ncbi:MAG: metallophosphoesterase [Oleiphilaceae bacterium]|nr:metallophosphoesterase [Oleiphilaceae bacterium]
MRKNSVKQASDEQSYDLIGDVHGCAQSLVKLLVKLGYELRDGCYRHAQRKVIFLGDIVDRGPRIREALHIVKNMVDQGEAEIVLGNHEFNAMCYCTPGRDGSGRSYLREHNARNHRLIRETLEQFAQYPEEWQQFLQWFREIPLFIDKGNFRVVHACWDQEAINQFHQQHLNNCVDEDFLHAASQAGTFEYRLVDKLTRGTALELPNGETILGKDGLARRMFRTKFWSCNPETYQDVVFQPDPLPPEMTSRKLTAIEKQQLLTYGEDEPPVFVGHYWMSGEPQPITPNIACLDYSAVKYGRLVAYRFDGEQRLSADKFVWVDVVRS